MNDSTTLSGHVAATRARVQASDREYLIAAQDTTDYNYSGQAQMSGLGRIQGKVRGLMQHNVLLMDDGVLPLGVISIRWSLGDC